MKLLIIDTSYTEYSQEFACACRRLVDTTVIRKYYTGDINAIPMFYKHSEKMINGKFRKILRVFEYFCGYVAVLKYIKRNRFDVIHIQWAQIPIFDRYVFKKIKKHCRMLIYTAHDVVPHEKSKRKIKSFSKLYMIPDRIVVHGVYCEHELRKYYPDCYKKVFVQKHGVAPISCISKNDFLLEKHEKLKKIMNDDKIVFLFIGQISPYKGLDLLLKAWEKFRENKNVALLVIGKTTFQDKETARLINIAKDYDNVYIYNERFDDEESVFFSYNLRYCGYAI